LPGRERIKESLESIPTEGVGKKKNVREKRFSEMYFAIEKKGALESSAKQET